MDLFLNHGFLSENYELLSEDYGSSRGNHGFCEKTMVRFLCVYVDRGTRTWSVCTIEPKGQNGSEQWVCKKNVCGDVSP